MQAERKHKEKNKKKYDEQITFMIDSDDYEKLMSVCDTTGYGKSLLMRTFFKKYFDEFKNKIENGRLI